MIQPARQPNDVLTVATCGVVAELSPEDLCTVIHQLAQQMKRPDQENERLWTTQHNGHEIWGILDQQAGPQGEDVFTILFPHEY